VAHLEATEALEQQIAKLGDQSIGVEANVSKLANLQKLVDAVVKRFGRLDINNAGIETRTSVLDTTEDQGGGAASVYACSRAPPGLSLPVTTSW
jgi:glucose 1-dehydrogenase